MKKEYKTFLQTISIMAVLAFAGSQAALAQAVKDKEDGSRGATINGRTAETPREAETPSDRADRERLESERARDTAERERAAGDRMRNAPAAVAATPRNKENKKDSKARIKGYMSGVH